MQQLFMGGENGEVSFIPGVSLERGSTVLYNSGWGVKIFC